MKDQLRNKLPEQHSFDFKVNVNYRSGNVSIRGPNQYIPPTINNIRFSTQQSNQGLTFSQASTISSPNLLNKNIPIIRRKDIYTQNRNNSEQNKAMSQNYGIYCIICDKNYGQSQFEAHLQIHKQRKKFSEPNLQINHSQKTQTQNYCHQGLNPMIRYDINEQQKHKSQNCEQSEYSFQKINQTPISSHNSSFTITKPERQNSFIPIQQSFNQNRNFNDSVHSRSSMSRSEQNSFHENSGGFRIQKNSSINQSIQEKYILPTSNKSSISSHKISYPQQNSFDTSRNIISGSFPTQPVPQNYSHQRITYLSNNSQHYESESQLHSDHSTNPLKSNSSFSYNYYKPPNYHTRYRSSQKSLTDQIIEKNAFKKNKIEKQLISHIDNNQKKDDLSSVSSAADLRQTLQNISRQDMIAISQSIKRSSVFSPSKIQYPSNIRYPEKIQIQKNIKSQNIYESQMINPAKSLSFNLSNAHHDTLINNKVFRGVQANPQQIELQVKSNESIISKSSKNTKHRLPKNALAVYDHLNSTDDIDQNSRSSLKSFKSLN